MCRFRNGEKRWGSWLAVFVCPSCFLVSCRFDRLSRSVPQKVVPGFCRVENKKTVVEVKRRRTLVAFGYNETLSENCCTVPELGVNVMILLFSTRRSRFETITIVVQTL